MSNRAQTLTVAPPRTYTRTDFAALRAYVQRVPCATIARLYYDTDHACVATDANRVEQHLCTMGDELVRLALLHGSTVLADHLKASIRQHGRAKLTPVTLRLIEQAARLAAAAPAPHHALGMWFRPLIARRLATAGIATLDALIDYCNCHGGSWWRSLPRIGPLRAKTLVAWLRRHAATLGAVAPDVDTREIVPSAAVIVGGPPDAPRLAPFERLAVPDALSGKHGANRAHAFAYIRAPHDLAALHAWLHRYRDRPATLRAYTREIERFVLWVVIVRRIAVSSVTVEDCDAYKDFLAAPSAAFCGPKRARASGRWRPFTPNSLSTDSQRYAVRTLRAAFGWLVDMRYLAGNPWHGVTDPATVTREQPIQVERALPSTLWRAVRDALDARCAGTHEAARQWRIARAAMLLMGESGLRSAEAASAQRAQLHRAAMTSNQPELWTLQIIGKRRKQRTVPVSRACIDALRAHWADRGEVLDAPAHAQPEPHPLLAPLVVPPHAHARARHAAGSAPYRADTLARLVATSVRRLIEDVDAFDAPARARLCATSAHAFRHTFGTEAVARDMPLDVVQAILGHASLQTTSIYTRAGAQRMLEEAARFYAADARAPAH